MEWLEAAIAFSVIMMIFSTMVAVLVENFFHRLWRFRQSGLQLLIQSLYQDAIQPRLKGHLSTTALDKASFAKHVTIIRYLPFAQSSYRLINVIFSLIRAPINSKYHSSYTSLEFIERFAETQVGRDLLLEAKNRESDYLDKFLDDIVAKFEDYGEITSQYFAKRAQYLSVIFSIILAVCLNISAIELFKTFLIDKTIRQQVIAQGDKAACVMQQQLVAQNQAVNNGKKSTNKNNIDTNCTFNISGPEHEANDKSKATSEGEKSLNELVKKLHSSSIPIGEKWPSSDIKEFIFRLIQVLFTGLLIGLGGPFWFDTFRKLSALTNITRQFQSATQKAKEVTATKDEKNISAKVVFLRAIKARELDEPV